MTTARAPLFRNVPTDAGTLAAEFQDVRRVTEALCVPLENEDYVIQAMAAASPAKWHLGHVSWFFEAFLLKPDLEGYEVIEPRYQHIFNSYYNSEGPQFSRPDRGTLSRPTVAQVYAYRQHVDDSMLALLEATDPRDLPGLGSLVVLGLNHEQQHQELLMTDLKYNLSVNPLRPPYHEVTIPRGAATQPLGWVDFDGGMCWIGHDGNGFAFDNEWPRHQTYVAPHRLGARLVTNGEYLEFMAAGAYETADHWLSDGWKTVQAQGWKAPLYWEQIDGEWWVQTLSGMQPLDEHGPVAHVSYYEADAYARWRGVRLPTEQEWEHAAEGQPIEGNFLESGVAHPLAAPTGQQGLTQLYGDLWEWTQSPYSPYPGYRPLKGGVGEYNGKFMVNQMVLRGGSCATPRSHIRPTYRNFFPPDARWQFSGIRLAADA